MKPSRVHIVRRRLSSGENCFAPVLGEYPGKADPALFGVFVDYGRKAIEFYDPYPSSDRATLAREAYVCDSAAISVATGGGDARTPQPAVFKGGGRGGPGLYL